MTSHISPECALNSNAPTFVGHSVNNCILHSSPGLQTSNDMITNIVNGLNISNDYFTANIEEVESDTSYSFCFSTSKTKWDTLNQSPQTWHKQTVMTVIMRSRIINVVIFVIWNWSLLITPCVQYLRSWCRRPIWILKNVNHCLTPWIRLIIIICIICCYDNTH